MHNFPFLRWIKIGMVVLDRFSFIWETKKKWSLFALDRWSSYTVTIVWEFAWVGSLLVVLDEWLSYRGGCINRFDCNSRNHKSEC